MNFSSHDGDGCANPKGIHGEIGFPVFQALEGHEGTLTQIVELGQGCRIRGNDVAVGLAKGHHVVLVQFIELTTCPLVPAL